MPTYSYACTECDDRFDAVQAFTDDTLTTCEKCSGRLRKLFNSVGVVFKGSGFYRTDSRESGKKTSRLEHESSTSRVQPRVELQPRNPGVSSKSRAASDKSASTEKSSSSSTSSTAAASKLAVIHKRHLPTGTVGAAQRLPCAAWRIRSLNPSLPTPAIDVAAPRLDPDRAGPAHRRGRRSSYWPASRRCGPIRTAITPRWWWPRATSPRRRVDRRRRTARKAFGHNASRRFASRPGRRGRFDAGRPDAAWRGAHRRPAAGQSAGRVRRPGPAPASCRYTWPTAR